MGRIIIVDVEDDLPLLHLKEPIESSDRFRLLTRREAVWFDTFD